MSQSREETRLHVSIRSMLAPLRYGNGGITQDMNDEGYDAYLPLH